MLREPRDSTSNLLRLPAEALSGADAPHAEALSGADAPRALYLPRPRVSYMHAHMLGALNDQQLRKLFHHDAEYASHALYEYLGRSRAHEALHLVRWLSRGIAKRTFRGATRDYAELCKESLLEAHLARAESSKQISRYTIVARFRRAALEGDWMHMRALTDAHAITQLEAQAEENYAFRWLALSGRTDALAWFIDAFRPSVEEARARDNEALCYSAHRGDFEMLRFLLSRFHFTLEDARARQGCARATRLRAALDCAKRHDRNASMVFGSISV